MSKPIVLYLGHPIKWNHDLYNEFTKRFTVVRNESLSRESFIDALKQKKYGDFVAIYRPFWNTGGEMGNWDQELMYRKSWPHHLNSAKYKTVNYCHYLSKSMPAPGQGMTGLTPRL